MSQVKIAVSLMSAPLTHLAEVVAELERAQSDMIHFDLEDGHFVPGALSLGTRLIGELRPLTSLPFDVHLMVSNPEEFIPIVARLGSDLISVHIEACPYPRRTLRQIKDLGIKAGLAFNPATPLPDLQYLLPLLDFVSILTTEPELPDWPYTPRALEKVRALATFGREHSQGLEIAVDGGIDGENIRDAVRAGANIIVTGRAAFLGGHIVENIAALRVAAREEAH
jgi:ribulose-phosphate 3-epimerase